MLDRAESLLARIARAAHELVVRERGLPAPRVGIDVIDLVCRSVEIAPAGAAALVLSRCLEEPPLLGAERAPSILFSGEPL